MKRIVRHLLIVGLALLGAAGAATAQSPPRKAEALVRAAFDAMGGEARWRALSSIRVEGIGHEHALEQSERPDGPWITTYHQFAELRDLNDGRLRRTDQSRGFWLPEWQTMVTVASREAATVERAGRRRPARPVQHADALERMALSPERVLFTALEARDLTYAGDTVLQGVAHNVVTFTWRERPVRLYLNSHTDLPAAVAVPGPTGGLLQTIWGDSPTLTVWSLWSLEPGGWLYPRQRDAFQLGHPLDREMLSSVSFNAPAPADSFAIPDSLRQAFAAGPAIDRSALRPGQLPGRGTAEAIELAPGVVTIPGLYATTWVEQSDGVVVLEGTMTSAWSRAVLDSVIPRFTDTPVKAVVSTSDAWPHIGGIREYAARGIPIYALELNQPLLEQLVAAPRSRMPDSLARAPRAPDFRTVGPDATIGTGPSRIELYPVRGEGGERMMVAWLPEYQILYASDLIQIGPDGTAFWPEYLMEVVQVVEREGLAPKTAFAMHTPPMPWTQVLDVLEQATGDATAAVR